MDLWTCPKCKRSFQKENQTHSCTPYPLAEHFKNKDYAKKLFDELLTKLKPLGAIKVESLPCCIHLVKPKNAYTFTGIYALKDGLRFHLLSQDKIESKRIKKSLQTSNNRYTYELETNEIDRELLDWIKKAYSQK